LSAGQRGPAAVRTNERSARRGARLERDGAARGGAHSVEDREYAGRRNEGNQRAVRGGAVNCGKRREGRALQAQLDMLLGRHTGCIAAGTEVLQRMQSRRRLPQDQGQQREPDDQRLTDCEQVRYLGNAGIL
jgi:hypothetical protein